MKGGKPLAEFVVAGDLRSRPRESAVSDKEPMLSKRPNADLHAAFLCVSLARNPLLLCSRISIIERRIPALCSRRVQETGINQSRRR